MSPPFFFHFFFFFLKKSERVRNPPTQRDENVVLLRGPTVILDKMKGQRSQR